MSSRVVRYRPGAGAPEPDSSALARRFAAIRTELHVPEGFPADVLAEAQQAAARPGQAPDLTDIPFWTLDPAGSMDLDQAMHLQRDGSGWRVRYAIADVPAFVAPGGALDAEARRRGQTIYLPDGRVPLHPPVLSEAAASLLPEQVRAAYVWDLRLAGDGALREAGVARAMVRSRHRRDYVQVQAALDAGTDDEQLLALRAIGTARQEQERVRGGASLPMPEQQVQHVGDGRYRLTYRPPVASEGWNAQLSLLTGMVAAQLMLQAGIGILRTMPAPDQNAVKRFRRQARALGVAWPDGQRYGEFLRGLDYTDASQLALIHEATSLFRGAGYTPFDGTAPAAREHAAVAAPYAHVTAPLRRLVDRFGLVVCAAVSGGAPVPDWARTALPQVPALMAESDRRAGSVERACTDAVEAAVLSDAIGQDFPASIVDTATHNRLMVQLTDPAVLAPAEGQGRPGDRVTVRVLGSDIAAGRVQLAVL